MRPARVPDGVARFLTTPRLEVLLVATVWVAILLPQIAASLSVTKGFEPITEAPVASTPAVAAITTAANALAVLVCAAVVLVRLRTVALRRVPVLVALLAPWVIAAVQLAVLGRPPGAAALVFPAVAAAFWVLRPGPGAVRTVGYLTGLTALVSLALGAFVPSAGRYPAQEAGLGKVIGPAGVLAGVMPSGNNLGLLLVVGLPTVLTIRRVSVRWTALGAVLLALAWTDSRTSWVAAVVVVLLLAALAWTRWPAVVAALGLGGLAAGGIILPFITTEPTAFTNRASYWIPTLAAWREHPLTGFGADYFKRLAKTAENLGGHAFQAHNEWVQLLITGGLLLTATVLVLLGIAAVRAVRLAADGTWWGAGWLAALLTVSILEVPFGFVDRTMFLAVVLVPLCLLICADPVGGRSRTVAGEGTSRLPDPAAARTGGRRG
ncbi:O-antigen ligase family protein [Pengzhenrongella sp.]|jgi:O-antigen ligase|uniref:O-antigen ligase family protein n=1 Tax=Pengzhenrongella sp. TaxID=2888820 RepID=UPI002F92483A